MACPLLLNPGGVLRRWISVLFLGSSLCFGQGSLQQQHEQDRTSSKTLDAGTQGCSWKRLRRMLVWYRSINCSQTALLALGRPNQVLSAVPGHLIFPLETPQPCWRAVGRSRSSASPLPPVHLASGWLLHGGCCWGVAAAATPVSMHKHTPLCLWSCLFPLAGAGGPQTHPDAAVLALVSPAP